MELMLLKNQKESLGQVRKKFNKNLVPKPEKCFTIIGPTTVDWQNAINVECEFEEDANKWISNLEVIISYFKRTKMIRSSVVIKK